MNARIIEADLSDETHARAVVELVEMYARDVTGRDDPLGDQVRANMIAGLRATPTTRVWLAYVDDAPAGVAVCFTGYSTFKAKPLINIHDLGVRAEMRGRGVGTALLNAVEQAARDAGCCAVTLEVDDDNHGARRLYERAGYQPGNGDQAQWFFKKLL